MAGPKLQISEDTGRDKHRQFGETFDDAMQRIATALQDDDKHGEAFLEILMDQRFLAAGRVQSAAGSFRSVTAFNCFVSRTIPDSMVGIMDALKEAALTMQKGGGIGYDFSTIRPRGDNIESMASQASGVLSFMEPFDAVCGTVASAGNRRGAQMGVLRVDHPDIRAFIKAKNNNTYLTRFNISVGITDQFMQAVVDGNSFDLRFNGKVYETVDARGLFNEIMLSTWDWAEPGVLFIDQMNRMNNLWYCETLAATNPCGEQPLPPHGACLLGSFNWVKYIDFHVDTKLPYFNLLQLEKDIPIVVRAMDNVIDRTIYPLPEQEAEAKAKRRMGLGATGVANAMEVLGLPYGSPEMLKRVGGIMNVFNDKCYQASSKLAKEKGAFPLYDERYLKGEFIRSLNYGTQVMIRENGIRNSHLTSIAPTGSISLAADNPSSGIEPPFLLEYNRKIKGFDDSDMKIEKVTDYAWREWGTKGRTADELTPLEHVAVLTTVQKYVDSACSKTCNIGPDVTFDEFKKVYMKAWKGGAKGCTTFRANGKRFGILTPVKEKRTQVAIEHVEEPDLIEGMACTFDPATGKKTCD